MLSIPPPLFALAVIYGVSISWWCGYLLLGDLQRRMRLKRQPDTITAVAAEALAERPELADDTEAVARTVAMVERIRAEAAADAAGAAFVTPGRRLADAFLAELFPRSKDAPKERP